MTGSDEDDRGYASPPCFMHELDPACAGLVTNAKQEADVKRWRKAERERLIAARLGLSSDTRRTYGDRIVEALRELIGNPAGIVVSAYWPFRGEPDLRGLFEEVDAGGGRGALRIVVERGRPLIFRTWGKGEPLERGVWNIPVPAGGEEVVPDIVISPVVGFDPSCYRLGYGGGFFDRTLAALPKRPRVLGVGYALQAIPTIYPQPHDIPMDVVVTEEGVVTPVKRPAD
ncbi:5-formyltetrahydrofolate cyclo-ligase [Lutibaculum baratangense]|uniref:5-formyltetrahydrofolate cyclo-ligase n=1 Tax=Lutibaculum baratangense AMV1 TaxID=631454 RepID=V4TAH3_9HYPH|nr:5-formyltetrahydrofolate cyclo-ligase [Lutibaculum baratangense]ESR23428.1 5-formyltetrahydrofolate cyclo-ligase [Lutibaculum baratangense AMV1]